MTSIYIYRAVVGAAFLGLLIGGPAAAHAAPTDAQKCASAKLKATGKFSLCRAKAMAVAVKDSTTPDYSKCAEKLQEAFDTAELQYGASCALGNSAYFLGVELADDITNLGCNIASPLSGTPGSVLIFDDFDAQPGARLYIKNASNQVVHVRCFSTDTGDRCSDSAFPCSNDSECAPAGTCVAGCNVEKAFDLTLFGQRQVYWYPYTGTGGVPRFNASSGQIVCVQVDVAGTPFTANSLLGGSAAGDECPTTSAIAVVGDPDLSGSDPPFTLNFGPSPNEYQSCPASIGASLMEGCWSQSEFTFVCD